MSQIRSYLHEQYPGEGFSDSNTIPAGSAPKERSSLTKMFQTFQQEDTTISDIDRYLNSPVITIDTRQEYHDDWIFTWWRSHAEEFPQILMARDFLAIPMAPTRVERLFSSGRDLVGLRRHCLQADTMRMLVLLRNVYINDT